MALFVRTTSTDHRGTDVHQMGDASMTDGEVEVNGVRLAIAEAGVGGRPLLLVHGFTGAKEDFTEWLDPLAAIGWHAVAADNRGHGKSDQPAGLDSYSFQHFAADTLALAEQRWPGRQIVLLGHSMGGMIAQVLALSAPERLAALILMDTGHRGLPIDPAQLHAVDGIVKGRGTEGLADIQARNDQPGPLDSPAHLRLTAERPGYREFNDGKLRAASDDMFRAMIAGMAGQPDRLGDLASIRVPTLVIVGEQDTPFIASSQRMADAIRGASLAVLPDAGHSPQFENPDAWWSAVSGFLASLGDAPAAEVTA
jgi:pimeloyl-ACP methyl ester carboxylesterase